MIESVLNCPFNIFKNKKNFSNFKILTASITSYKNLIFWIFQFLAKPSNLCNKFHNNLRGSLPFSSKSFSLQMNWPKCFCGVQCTVYSVHIEFATIWLGFLKFVSGSGTTRKVPVVTGSGINHSGSTTFNNDRKKKMLFQRKKQYFTKAVFAEISQ